MATTIAAKYDLHRERRQAVGLTPTSLTAMVGAAGQVYSRKPRVLVSSVTYVSTASSTGFRYGTMGRGSDEPVNELQWDERGLRYSNVVLWLQSSANSDPSCNEVVGYVRPSKIKGGRYPRYNHKLSTWFPLFDTPKLGTSANLMLLLSLWMDTSSSLDELERVLHPSYLGAGQHPRRLTLPDSV